MNLRLEDLLAQYPDIDEPRFQEKISAKTEFSELATPINFNPADHPSGYFPHQIMFIRYLSEYTELLYMADTGTGKTRSLIGLMETFKAKHQHIKHVYFLTGKAQIDDFKLQLLDVPGNEYRVKYESSQTQKSKRRAVTSAIRPWYTVTTYSTFVNRFFPMPGRVFKNKKRRTVSMTDEEIKAELSGSIFFLDEVQKIKIDSKAFGNIDTLLGTGEGFGVGPSTSAGGGGEKKTNKLRARFHNYVQLWRALHLVERSIKIIASARPVINKLEEFIFHMNLILPIDKQLYHPLMEKVYKMAGFTNVKTFEVNLALPSVEELTQELLPFLQGRVMYFRAFKTGAVPTYPKPTKFTMQMGRNTYESELRLTYVAMSKFQKEVYYLARGFDPDKETELFDLEKSQAKPASWYQHERRAANFVFPDRTWSSAGFNKYVSVSKDGDRILAKGELKSILSRPGGLHYLSAKAYQLVKAAVTQFGKRYFYSSFVTHGGVFMFALALQYGDPDNPLQPKQMFEQFNDRESVFSGGRINRNFPKKLRYAVVTGRNSASYPAIFELFNSPENVAGEYIKVIIVSQVAQIGINLSDCLHEDNIEPDFSPSTQYQSDKRIMRATSHAGIIKYVERHRDDPQVRAYLGPEGYQPGKVKVYINYWTAVNGENLNDVFVDEKIYRYAQFKDVEIGRLARVCEMIDVSAQIQFQHNYRPEAVDGSPECNYLECYYQPVDPLAEPGSDTSTFDVYYIDQYLDKLIDGTIRRVFRRQSSITVERLMQINTSVKNEKYFYMAFEKMIDQQISIYDRYGMESYIHEAGQGTFYLSHIYPRNDTGSDYLSSYYDTNLISIHTETLPSINLELNLDQLGYIWSHIMVELTHSEEFRKIIIALPESDRYRILADAMNKARADPNAIINDSYVNGLYYHFREFIDKNRLMLQKIAVGDIIPIWDNIHQILGSSEEFQTVLGHLSNAAQTAVLEDVLSQLLVNRERQEDPYVRSIIRRYNKLFARINKPVDSIRQSLANVASENYEFSTVVDPQLPIVVIHRIYNPRIQTASYGATAKFKNVEGQIRVLEPSLPDAKWRDALDYESRVYKTFFSNRLRSEDDKYSGWKVYGSILESKLKIVDRRFPDSSSGGKKNISGRVCSNFNALELIDKMLYLDIPIPDDSSYLKWSRDRLIRFLKSRGIGVLTIDGVDLLLDECTDYQLRYFTHWLGTRTFTEKKGRTQVKDPLCKEIFQFFLDRNMVETPDSGIPAREQYRAIITGGKVTEDDDIWAE